ncbi:MAG: DUF2332 domain-containing protein [Erythrobacter sp.]|uniref:DUF2332 domain-containing protein n=1 Tax=Erythrobacter sp. TaxID=1042 RepID=UPI0026251205|nr:DUF2332 domain-containing protein [Erythrobacter sp.]MDJ0977029.1 DUF2332 domain-containing protein [Erythrobacter sp.]
MMGIEKPQYQLIDPLAKGPDAVRRAFANQVAYCRDNLAPNTATVCFALLELLDTDRGGAVMEAVRAWEGPALADALPLRVVGGIHALHLSGKEPSLAPIYAGAGPLDATARIADALERHEADLHPWLDGPPQTNEAGRSWGFAAAMLWLADQGLPSRFAMHEIGSSAGINLMMERFAFDLGGVTLGPAESPIALAPEWRGGAPPDHPVRIVSITGCDVAPIDLTDGEQALRLKAFVWPELTERFARMDGAIELAHRYPPHIDRLPAGDFVEKALSDEVESGTTRMLFHSVVWQYIPADERRAITDAIAQAGAAARADSPLAWVSLEANRDTHRHELKVRYWPGGEAEALLATAHPHGAWVEWTAR